MTQNIWGFPSNQSTTFQEALGYKKYVALLTQSGIDAPIATVFENTIGNIVWTRDSPGNYKATLNGAFITDKTMVNAWLDFYSCEAILAIGQTSTEDYCYFYTMTDANYFNPTSSDLNGKGMWVEIRIYP